MALSNAEKQAAFRARKAEKIDSLTAEVEALKSENADLQAKLARATAKVASLQKKLAAAKPTGKGQ